MRKAKKIANENIKLFQKLIGPDTPLIGIEPSAILTFRDEYVDLADTENGVAARALAENALLFEEFFMREVSAGRIGAGQFHDEAKKLVVHGHCQQKAVASVAPMVEMLSVPSGYDVSVIPSGCCGMAGSFGYEKEHYEISMQIGNLVLFPAVRQQAAETVVVAPGTSCRHQIWDGTGRKALHPVEVLFNALA